MQYLVCTEGKVVQNQRRTYTISANNEEEAARIAEREFKGDYNIIDGNVVSKLTARNHRAVISLVLMIIPILLSFIEWKNGHDTYCFKPDFLSCLYSFLLYSVYLIRIKGIKELVKMTESWIDIVFLFIIPLLFATLIRIVFISGEIDVLGLVKLRVDMTTFMVVIILLSVLGVKIVSVLCLGVVFIMSLFSITGLNEAMGSLWGCIYILCTFVGIIIYSSIEPAFAPFIGRVIKSSIDYEIKDIESAKGQIGSKSGTVSRYAYIKSTHKEYDK